MGTRARINIISDWDKSVLCSIYKHGDGYPDGLGVELKDAIGHLRLVNGISYDDTNIANGMGCLAAQLIAKLKDDVGDVSIRNTSPKSNGEEFIYTLRPSNPGGAGIILLTVAEGRMTAFGAPGDEESGMKPIYDGPLADFEPPSDDEE